MDILTLASNPFPQAEVLFLASHSQTGFPFLDLLTSVPTNKVQESFV